MKLFEKLKNALFEEEYVEVEEVKPKKKEKPIAKKIELPDKKEKMIKEEPRPVEKETENETEEILADRELLKGDPGFKFPIVFEEEDFIEETKVEKPTKSISPVEMEKPKSSAYSKPDYSFHEYGAYEKKEEKKVFRPSPIISPIYGVLDRNYKKEDIVTKKEIKITSSYGSQHLDLDAVREKAYGNLENEMGLSMTEEEKEHDTTFDLTEEENNLLVDMRDEETTPVVTKITVGDAEEYFQDLGLEYNVDYKDAMKEKATGRRVNKNYEERIDAIEESEDAEPPIMDSKVHSEMKEETTLEDNLFDLIDSMYEDEKE